MAELGLITYKHKDKKGHFYFNFRISDYDAAKILEYIAQRPHKSEQFRNSKGQFKPKPLTKEEKE